MAKSKSKRLLALTGERSAVNENLVVTAQRLTTTDRRLLGKRLAESNDDELKQLCKKADLKVKDRGDHFIGRAEEIDSIISRMLGTIRATEERDRKPRTIITGAPGVGKTTLVQEIETCLKRDHDVDCIMIPTAAFQNPESFSDTMKTKTDRRFHALLTKAPDGRARVSASSTDAAATILVELRAIAEGMGWVAQDVEVHAAANAYDAWRRNETVPVEQCLRTLAFLFPKGVAIIVDEAQTLEDQLDHRNPKRSTASKIVQSISTPAGRATAEVPRVDVIYAGLGDTVEVIETLGSFGLEHVQLQPMGEDSIEDLIEAEINDIVPPITAEARQAIRKAWVPNLITEYGEWTRLAAAAASATYQVVNHLGIDALRRPEGWAGVIAIADKIRERVYDYVRQQAGKHSVPNAVMDTIGFALAANNNELTQHQVVKIIIAVLDDLRAETASENVESMYAKGPETVLKGCKRCGLLDVATSDTPNVRLEMLYSPVPSLLRHIVQNQLTATEEIQSWLNQCEIDGVPAKRFTKRDTGPVRDGRKPK